MQSGICKSLRFHFTILLPLFRERRGERALEIYKQGERERKKKKEKARYKIDTNGMRWEIFELNFPS